MRPGLACHATTEFRVAGLTRPHVRRRLVCISFGRYKICRQCSHLQTKIETHERHRAFPHDFRRAESRAFRRADRRRRHLRRRQRLPSRQTNARHQFRGAGGAGDVWRHLVDPQISGHPFRQRPAHLRLQFQAVGRTADRDRRGNPCLYGRGDRGQRPRQTHPLQSPHQSCELVERDQSLDGRCRQQGDGRSAALHRELPLDVPGLLPPFRRLHAGMEGHGQVQGPDRPSADLAQGPRHRRQEGRRDRFRRHGRHADPEPQMRACHHAAALADLFPHRPQRHRARRGAAPAAGQGGMDPRDRAAKDPVRAGLVHQALLQRAGSGEEGIARCGRCRASGGL